VTVPAPASTAEALAMVRAGMDYLAAADPAALSAQAQAECLHALEQLDAVETAARARILAAFTAGQGYSGDADYSPASWLIHRTRITKAAARGHLGWARRAAAHPQVLAALAEGTVLTESMAAAGADHVRRGGCHLRGPHARVRRRGHRGAGCPVRPAGRRGHPDQGPALPRRARGRPALIRKLHRDSRHIGFARLLRTQAPTDAGAAAARGSLATGRSRQLDVCWARPASAPRPSR